MPRRGSRPARCEPEPRERRWAFWRVAWFVRARLQRRLFVWFGVTIAATALLVGLTVHLVGRVHHVPWPLPLAIAVVVVWIASGRIAWRLARPIAELSRVAQEIGSGRLSSRTRLTRRQAGEVGVLADAIDDMAERIERQMSDQRELLAAVSHELRTPLGRIRLLAELVRSRPSPEEREKKLDELEREVLEMDALVGELLAAARLDFSALAPRRLDPADVARRALERAGLEASLLALEAPAGTTVDADPTLLARALANMLDNARVHGGGAKRLTVRREQDDVVFEVHDGGAGFDDVEAERIFEPFYRKRTGPDDADRASLGLGLALVRRIAEAHGGRSYAQDRDEGGARVGIAIPRSREGVA